MSLDTVALVMQLEKRFDIRFEDDHMGSIHTVEQIAAEVCRILGVEEVVRDDREMVADIVRGAMLGRSEADLVDFPLRDQVVAELLRSLEGRSCVLPELGPFKSVRVFFVMQEPRGTLEALSIGQFIDRIVAYNHLVLIREKVPASRYAVMMVVLGIVADSTGVPIMRIALEDSLTNDLGLD